MCTYTLCIDAAYMPGWQKMYADIADEEMFIWFIFLYTSDTIDLLINIPLML